MHLLWARSDRSVSSCVAPCLLQESPADLLNSRAVLRMFSIACVAQPLLLPQPGNAPRREAARVHLDVQLQLPDIQRQLLEGNVRSNERLRVRVHILPYSALDTCMTPVCRSEARPWELHSAALALCSTRTRQVGYMFDIGPACSSSSF